MTETRSRSGPARFAGKRVVVTGAAGGVGATLVEMFRTEGARVVGCDVTTSTDPDLLEVDLRDTTAVEAFAASAVDRLGGVDVLCNVAGVQRFAQVGDITADALHLHLDVNLVAPVLLTQALVPALAESRGNVVTIASISAVTAQGYNSVYCASKAGLLMAMRSMAIELAKVRVRVNCVSPGGIETPMPHTSAAQLPEDIDWDLLTRHSSAFPGFMPPSDVCDAVLFLASDHAVSITGSNLVVDRGVVW
ncbi:SDR family NAD(P)-dependent oxidoreductase [Nocardioides marmoribigeumensis]|uniref:Meso-butanediol dehydrogenase/(S,S)-butanediol dehydrogenase/diacetyl reductase n=1 Tax=Nocardioides marmoribigeumensis TaxID=433649 RepID=A0ABU2BZ26_9ACTN|nr:SDR family oxidoreductase [Nocardioides marmoribigeumensis]MDR7363652.1 meso-butanediol dehydrogenase/(S,S)-butanediol dehydrogenase/diacetyl reductase [Nocardioides marmoribigeumensis]